MIKILITGDFCPINRIDDLITKDRYNDVYNDFITNLTTNDLNITNLECPIYDGINSLKKIGPSIKTNKNSLNLLKHGNFNLVTLANNHIMDFGLDGLESTIEACMNTNISYVGAGKNLEEARRPYIKEVNGIKIAILNFTENEFSTTDGNYHGANPLNPITNYYDIIKIKPLVDFVFVIVHGGHEYYQLPSPRIQETYRFYIDAGADTVISHHTHCYSGFELYKGKNIFYGLGNFIFDWPNKRNNNWNIGFAVLFKIVDLNINYEIIPYKQCNDIAGILLLDSKEKEFFNQNLTRLSQVISNKEEIQKAFSRYIKSNSKTYQSFLEPFSNKILRYLLKRGIIPSLNSKNKKRLLLNLIRCESHRDLMINSLKEEL